MTLFITHQGTLPTLEQMPDASNIVPTHHHQTLHDAKEQFRTQRHKNAPSTMVSWRSVAVVTVGLVSASCILALEPTATANTATMKLHHPYPSRDIFLQRYAKRLGFDDESYLLDVKPSMSLLCELQERHLCRIPFENLSQHGLGGPVVLDLDIIADKILDRRRGGFCLELNSLFAALLQACGFDVTIVEAIVFKGTFDGIAPSHVCLMVEIPTTTTSTDERSDTSSSPTLHYVDVGFGEPPLNPLQLSFDTEQITPEGMRSRLVLDDGDNVILEWWKDGAWVQRLRWRLKDARGGVSLWLPDMVPYLEEVSQQESIFSKKLVVCHLFRDQKHTVSGNSYKITGAPRYYESDEQAVPVEQKEGLNLESVQEILWNQFSIPKEETATLDLEQSCKKENAEVWSQW